MLKVTVVPRAADLCPGLAGRGQVVDVVADIRPTAGPDPAVGLRARDGRRAEPQPAGAKERVRSGKALVLGSSRQEGLDLREREGGIGVHHERRSSRDVRCRCRGAVEDVVAVRLRIDIGVAGDVHASCAARDRPAGAHERSFRAVGLLGIRPVLHVERRDRHRRRRVRQVRQAAGIVKEVGPDEIRGVDPKIGSGAGVPVDGVRVASGHAAGPGEDFLGRGREVAA